MTEKIRREARVLAAISAGSLASIVLGLVAAPALAQGDRCAAHEAGVQQSMDRLGVVEVCQFLAASAGDSAPELPEAVMTGAGEAADEAVVSSEGSDGLRFAIPEEYGDYRICSYSRDQVSELPPFGGFIEHGWENLTERSIDYGWSLRQRGLGRGDTRLQADLYFSFVPAGNLASARDAGLCMQDLEPRNWR